MIFPTRFGYPYRIEVDVDFGSSVTWPGGPALYFDLTVAVDPALGGTTMPAAGVHSQAEGTVVAVSATPASGYEFDHWGGDCTGTGSCSVTMDADKSVTAYFTQIMHDLTVAVDPALAGTTVPAVGVHSYAEGSVVAVSATPASGYAFDHWGGDCTGSGSCSVTMDADKSVTASFAINTYTLSDFAGAGGSLTGNASQTVNYGEDGTAVTATYPIPATSSWSGATNSTANPRSTPMSRRMCPSRPALN